MLSTAGPLSRRLAEGGAILYDAGDRTPQREDDHGGADDEPRHLRRVDRARGAGGLGRAGVANAGRGSVSRPDQDRLHLSRQGPLAQLGIDLRDGFLLYWGEVGN